MNEEIKGFEKELQGELAALIAKVESKYNTKSINAADAAQIMLNLRDTVGKGIAGIEQDVFYNCAREKGISPTTPDEKEILKVRKAMRDELPYFEESGKLLSDKKKFSGAITHNVNMTVKNAKSK